MTKINNLKLRPPKGLPADWEWIGFGTAWDEIMLALNVSSQVAEMLLNGLVATGNVRADGIDIDECKIVEFQGKATLVSGLELREWLSEVSRSPRRRNARDQMILSKLAEGIIPGNTIPWKKFCDSIRDGCNGWFSKGKPAMSYGDKAIQRAVNKLRDA